MIDEIWFPTDYPGYEVSSQGRVRSSRRQQPRILKPWLNRHTGYLFVAIHNSGQSNKTVHDLVCTAFHGPKPSSRHQAAHFDGNKTNNTPNNLRWALPVENNGDKRRHGTHFNSGQFERKLTPEQVREIRTLLAAGMKQAEIGATFGVRQGTISAIKLRRHWADLD